jgi:hypothetical protein
MYTLILYYQPLLVTTYITDAAIILYIPCIQSVYVKEIHTVLVQYLCTVRLP